MYGIATQFIMMSYLFVPVFVIQSIPRHLTAVLSKVIIITVGTDEDDIQVMAIWSILESLVPINQLWGKLSIIIIKYNILIHPCILGNRGVITKILPSPRHL